MDKLRWGKRKRKRMRCVKVKDSPLSGKSEGGGAVVKKKITSRVVDNNCSKDGSVLPPVPSSHRPTSIRVHESYSRAEGVEIVRKRQLAQGHLYVCRRCWSIAGGNSFDIFQLLIVIRECIVVDKCKPLLIMAINYRIQ
ncbi:hypothetical protein SASPL_106106 [Salvia splendens]|uniref:Uncharacterized protein n=1 Tax=Salvia splendens TaxID=180675 RepID=A0A8X8YMZ0_SALSN|nr:hypothetical protein SASPL_106106 [Salvia splendens]